MKTKIFIFAFLIFTLNDLLFAVITLPWLYFIADYLCRVAVLLFFILGLITKNISLKSLRFNKINIKTLFIQSLNLTLIGFFLSDAIEPLLPSFGFLHYPDYPNVYLKIFDLSIGLLLVALSEEVVFRGLLLNLLNRYSVIVSSILFGLIHWGSGIATVVVATLIGIFFAHTTLKTNSIYPVLIAHFCINFLLFI